MYSQFPLAAKAIFIICLYRIVHCPDPVCIFSYIKNQSDVVSNSPETPYTSIAEFGSAQTLPEAKISKDMSVQENQILSFPSAQEFSVEDFQRGQEAGTSNDLSNPEADQESSSSSQESTVVATQSLPGEGSSLDTTSGEPIPNQNDLSPQQKAKAYLDTLNCDEVAILRQFSPIFLTIT
ncbi:hypothetical protein RF11_07013 [Thelohanellus kitauei]|uniref:Uncharacterized protein n=1 Tax=Thelohanellus kitauei TaxID=669202 RepID=A0A0C2MMA0_THEKT|nr:hypothetical protein RF11_07013 [Thelohanellus kitauei]